MSIRDTARAPRHPWVNSSNNGAMNANHEVFPSLTSATTLYSSDIKAFDIEVDMAQNLNLNDPNARPSHFRNNFEECIFVFTVMMATASTTFLQGVIIINTANIAVSLNMTGAQMTWIAAAIGLGSGSFMLFFGKTADLLGRKIQLLGGMAFLSLSSLLAAFVPNAIALNVLCGFLGLGTAAIAPPAIGTLFATYQEGTRLNKATGALGSGNPVGFILGSISSGIATRVFNWRASFIIIAIFFCVMTVLAMWTMPIIPRAGEFSMVARRFDYLGTALTVVGMGLFSAALTQGPELGWLSPIVILMVIFGLVCLFGFVAWERIYKYPLLDPSVWKNKNFTLCVLCTFFGYMSFITNQFWISLYMQEIQKLAPLHIAVRLLPQAIAGIAWSYIGQYLASRMNGTIVMGIGAFAYLVGATLLIFIRERTSYWMFLFPALCVTVLGADFQFIISNLYVNKQMPQQSSLAAGVLQTAMRLSVSLGLAITTAVYGSVLSHTQKGQANFNVPFERAYLCSIIFAVAGLLIVPFMRLGTHGGKPPPPSIPEQEMPEEDRPRTGGEYSDSISSIENYRSQPEWTLNHKGSETSLWSGATYGSQDSYFPRWSWEDEQNWKFRRHGSAFGNEKVTYEVCVKCLEERRVVLATPMKNYNHHHNVYEARMAEMRDPDPYHRSMAAEMSGAVGGGERGGGGTPEGWL